MVMDIRIWFRAIMQVVLIVNKGVIPGPSSIENAVGIKYMMELYPNPAKSSVTAVMPYNADWLLDIYDSFGRHLQQIDLTGAVLEIDINKLRSGLYIVVASQKTIPLLLW
jgi:hypothetical protein